MSQLDPIVNQPNLYMNGLILSNNATTPHTKLDIAAGQCRDSNNILDINLGNYLNQGNAALTANSATVVNFGINGAGGLDTGSLAASTFYYVFAIADSSGKNQPSALASLSASAPLLPFGYDSIRLLGAVKSDASPFLLAFYAVGNGLSRFFEWDAPIAITVTASGTSSTYSAMDLSPGMPASSYAQATMYAKWDPNAAADVLNFTPAGATGDYIVNTAISTTVQDLIFVIKPLTVSSVPKVSYKISAGTLTAVNLMGFGMSL